MFIPTFSLILLEISRRAAAVMNKLPLYETHSLLRS